MHPADPGDEARLWQTCLDVGFTDRKLATQQEAGDVREAFEQLTAAAGVVPSPALFGAFSAKVKRLAGEQELVKRARGEHGRAVTLSLFDAVEAARSVRDRPPSPSSSIPIFMPGLGAMPRMGIRRVRQEARAASVQERADAEGAELSRWRTELKAYFVESSVPAIRLASECLDPERALAGFIGRTRAGTLRAYVRCWGQLRRWLLTARGSPWPTTPSDIIDYLHVRLDEPCGASVPQSVLQAIVWVEKVAGLEDKHRVSLRPEVGRAFAAASSELGLTAPPTRRAPRFPVAILAAFEKYIMVRTNPDYLRGLAWIRLIKVWATLRFDDHTWLRPSALSLTDGTLAAVLTRAKTSGCPQGARVAHGRLGGVLLPRPGLAARGLRPVEEDGGLPKGLPTPQGEHGRQRRRPKDGDVCRRLGSWSSAST